MESHDYKPVATDPNLPPPRVVEREQLWRQYVFCCTASITSVLSGFAMGWTSPVNMKLQDVEQSPLSRPVTKDEEALIGSLLTIGAMFGPFIGSFIATKIGRKNGLLAISVPFFVGFFLIIIAKSVMYLYIGRILWGLAVGSTFTVLPMYSVELATVDARGRLASFLELFVMIGFLVVYAIGPYVSYHAVAYYGVGITAVCGTFFFLPESPRYHLMKNNTEKAAASLMYLRGRSRKGVEEELAELIEEVEASKTGKKAKVTDIFKGGNFKALYIPSMMLFFQQFSGIDPVMFYTATIFQSAGSHVDPSISAIIIGFVQVCSSLVSSILIEMLGRRVLMLISSAGTAVGLGFFGWYFYLVSVGSPMVEQLGLAPLISLTVFVISYSFGLGPIPWTVLNELQSIEIKAITTPMGGAVSWGLGFIVSRYFGPVGDAWGMHVVFWIFAACCATCFVFTLLVVPETKGKTAMEIQDMLAGRPPNSRNQDTENTEKV